MIDFAARFCLILHALAFWLLLIELFIYYCHKSISQKGIIFHLKKYNQIVILQLGSGYCLIPPSGWNRALLNLDFFGAGSM